MHQHLSGHRRGAYELFEISFKDAVRALERVVGPAKIVRQKIPQCSIRTVTAVGYIVAWE
jgi:hypothetical protein